jgi:hypothetical protein
MSGTGAESGDTINIYDEDNNVVATTEVQADGTWNTDISNLDDTPINDNEFFKATETDPAGNETAETDTTHYNHFDWTDSQTDNFDDFNMAGSGDDNIRIDDNDANDKVVIDGGDGNDTATFDGKESDYTITTDSNGYTIVTENVSTDSDGNGVGDVNELRNIENIVFTDDVPQVEITGVDISSSFSNVSIFAGAALTTGDSAVLNGDIMTGAATNIGANATLGGNIFSGAATTTGANADVSGDILSGAAVTAGAGATIDGDIAAVAAITAGAGSSQETLADTLMASEQADALAHVIDAQSTLQAMGGEALGAVLGNVTLDAGVYSAASLSTTAGTTLTLDGQGLDDQTWIFNVADVLALGANTTIELINAGEGSSVIWNSYDGYATIGADADIIGTVYAHSYITVGANTYITGPDGTNGGLFTETGAINLGAGANVGIASSTSAANANLVTGTAEANSEVTIHSEGSILGTTVADSAGNFTYELTTLNVTTLAAEPNNSITASIDIDGTTVTSDAFTYNDELDGTYGDDDLTGTIGDDAINGGLGDDTIDGGAGDDTIDGGAGDDTIVFDEADTIDGGDGYDILDISSGGDLDFSAIDDVTNIEAIDLGTGSETDINVTNIDINDVLNMTDDDNELTIFGDEGDTVTLATDTWTQDEGTVTDADGNEFNSFTTGTGLTEVQLLIDNQVNVEVNG